VSVGDLLGFLVGLIVGGTAVGVVARIARARMIEAATNAAVRCGANHEHFRDALDDEFALARQAPLTPLTPRR
jgi:hypothetical protein